MDNSFFAVDVFDINPGTSHIGIVYGNWVHFAVTIVVIVCHVSHISCRKSIPTSVPL